MPSRTAFAAVLLLGSTLAVTRSDAADAQALVGNPAPDFQIHTVRGAPAAVSLRGWQGNVVIVDFWGTFCGPCKKSFPKIEALRARYEANGLRVVAISEDEPEDKGKIPSFADNAGARFPLAWDGDKSIARRYALDSMPSTFVIDRRGVVRFVHAGFRDGEENELDAEVRKLLGN